MTGIPPVNYIILYNLYSGLFTDIMRTIMESGSSIMAIKTKETRIAKADRGVFDGCRHGS